MVSMVELDIPALTAIGSTFGSDACEDTLAVTVFFEEAETV